MWIRNATLKYVTSPFNHIHHVYLIQGFLVPGYKVCTRSRRGQIYLSGQCEKSALGHFIEGHFIERHIIDGHFIEKEFHRRRRFSIEKTFHRQRRFHRQRKILSTKFFVLRFFIVKEKRKYSNSHRHCYNENIKKAVHCTTPALQCTLYNHCFTVYTV